MQFGIGTVLDRPMPAAPPAPPPVPTTPVTPARVWTDADAAAAKEILQRHLNREAQARSQPNMQPSELCTSQTAQMLRELKESGVLEAV